MPAVPRTTTRPFTFAPMTAGVSGYPFRDRARASGAEAATLRIADRLAMAGHHILTADFTDFGYLRTGHTCPLHGWLVEYRITDRWTDRPRSIRVVWQPHGSGSVYGADAWRVVIDHDHATRSPGTLIDPAIRFNQGDHPGQVAGAIQRALLPQH